MNRRRFLKGALGATLGLPLLSSLDGKSAKAAPGDFKRLVVFFCCNGVNMDTFWPTTGYGAIDAAALGTCTLSPLSAFADRILLPRGIHMVPRGFGWDPSNGDDHAKGMGHKLTAHALGSTTYAEGISVDQYVANALNAGGTPALTLLVGYKSDSVLGHISYSGPEQPVTGENNPWLAYQDLVGLGNLDDEAFQRLMARRQSVLDLVRPEYEALLSKNLSKADRDKLDMHFTAVRDLENTMGGTIACNLDPTREAELEGINPDTVAYDSEFRTIGRMQMDVMAMAIACGATSAATLQWGSGAGGPIFTWDGMAHAYNHHKLSHGNTMDDCSGGMVDGYLDMLTDIDRWYAGELAYLLGRLDAYEEGAGSVLDNTCVLMMNELSHGKDHDFRDLPIVMAGSCGGYFKTGEYIKVTAQADTRNDADSPHNKLLTTICNAVGVTDPGGGPVTNFGNPAFGEPGEFDMLKA
jgi:hypothetical protein